MSDFSYAEHLLKHLGFDVIPIEESSEEQADWVATLAKEVALVEEKTKLDDPHEVARRDDAYKAGQPFESHVHFTPNNTLSGITKKAVGQLKSSASGIAHDYRLICVTATGHSHEGKFYQYVATLYGSTNVAERDSLLPLKACYFFRNSEFFRHRDDLDGAIVAETDGTNLNVKLCLNPLSPRYSRLKESAIRHAFGTAVLDPIAEEAIGEAFIVDCDLNRSQEAEILEYVQKKYRTDHLMPVDMAIAGVSMVLGRGDD